ncbi:hypothetical protein L2E82_08124 [Cichorium intybus]|uniref:Uncharacterized protein n=1 Tax=Cichorium intybus TaxID=13427 RepID=A0ACB9G6M4_CICIN|nr:hypothetical protein L2E82_08124 [Cichorium intybus]
MGLMFGSDKENLSQPAGVVSRAGVHHTQAMDPRISYGLTFDASTINDSIMKVSTIDDSAIDESTTENSTIDTPTIEIYAPTLGILDKSTP